MKLNEQTPLVGNRGEVPMLPGDNSPKRSVWKAIGFGVVLLIVSVLSFAGGKSAGPTTLRTSEAAVIAPSTELGSMWDCGNW